MNTTPLLELLSVIALKGAVVLFVALVLGLVLRRMAAARRHALWITAIATLAVLPLAMWALPAWRVLPQTDAARDWPVMDSPMVIDNASSFLPPEDDSSGWHGSKPALPVPAEAPARPVFSWDISWQDVVDSLLMVWMLIAGLLLLRLGHSAWRLHRLEAFLRPGECALVPQTARELGLQRLPRLLIGPSDAVPMVWGVLSPRLLLPQGFETWSPEKQRGVLLHELAHLKRGDPLALWAAQWVKALHWFNPLVWLTLRQLRADQERACDDAVLRHGVRASDYAQSLLDLSRHTRLAPGLSLCALTITRCAPVEARVKAILDPRRSRESLTVRWLLALAGGALLITLPVAMLHAIEGPTLRGRILDRNGVVLAESTKEKVRNYPLKTLAAHMVGYTRIADEKHVQIYGGAALEKQHDTELTAGKDVTLTLDMRMQSLAYRAMQEAGVTRGAAVVLDPRTGEILAAVSLPSFDPNLFIPVITQENWDTYLGDRDIPLLNRCLKGFVPGSSYKLLTGLAGGAAGISGQKFNCTGSVTYGNKTMQCWKQRQDGGGHGVLGMSDGLAMSCSCFWYQFGNAAGIDQIESMGQKIGFGSTYGISDDESPGILPTPAWLIAHRPQEQWSEGYTANTSVGQGMVVATPLQMAVLAATVGNRGKVPQPAIVKPSGASSWRVDLTQGTLTAADVEPLREGMRLVVNSDSGTGKPARSDKVIIAGKTGTAQNWRLDANKNKVDDNHGWFVGFAPFENPRLAFAIVKNGAKSGGGDCGPIAKRIVEEALALPADGSGEVQPVGDQVGIDHEKLQQLQAQFDANAASLKAAIEGIKPDATTGFSLSSITVDHGQLVVLGVASGMIQALQFREKLVQLEALKKLDWTFPVPMTLEDGKRVQFSIWGNLWSTKSLEKAPATTKPADQAQIRQGSDEDIRMKPALAKTDIKVVPKPSQIFKKMIAMVIGRSSSASSNSLVIDKGSLDGIVANSPVITSVGLVGKTATPEAHTTKVILLTDELCRVSAKVEGTFEQGILAGERAAQAGQPQLRLRFLSRDAKINIGSRVYSTGEGGVFPADQLLGRVKEFISGDVSGEAIVEPAVDFSTLDEVFVMELKTGAPDQGAAAPTKPADQAQDADILMDPQLADRWRLLKRKGYLADLPAKAVIPKPGTWMVGAAYPFQFTAPREEVKLWLAGSLGDAMRTHYDKEQPWPEKPGVFDYTYEGFGDCMFHIKTLDAETVEVRLWLQSKGTKQILIAPDEAAPPTLKTAAPKELSGVVSNDAQKRSDASVVKFEFDAGETSRQIKALSAEAGIVVKEFKMGQGRVSIIGEASGMVPARKYLFKLLELGKERNVRWALPATKALENQSVQFEASGVYGTAALPDVPPDQKGAAPPKPANQAQLPISDDAIRLRPELAKQWSHLKAAGLLADLPAEAVVISSNTELLEQYAQRRQMLFRFSLPREAARRWLVDSVFVEDQREKLLNWPNPPASFNGTFTAANNCTVIVSCQQGETVHVMIFQPLAQLRSTPDYSRPLRPLRPLCRILIAPDESQEPRPTGKLAPEYPQEGLTAAEPAVPKLDATLQTLRSTISPDEEKSLPWFVFAAPIQLNLQAADLPSDAMNEEEALLRDSRTARNRAQQALLVRLPLMR